ncbi:MAG: acetylglutamate kinase [Planctomycetota bacterium]
MSRPIVVKIGGSALEQAGSELWSTIAKASATWPLVVVHGGGETANARLAAHGFASDRVGGLRLTPPEHVGIVAGALSGEVNTRVVAALNAAGAKAVGLTLVDAGSVECENAGLAPGDRVGRVSTLRDDSLFIALRASKLLPVVSSIGADSEGLLNINADDAAEGLAIGLNASKLVYLTDVDGVFDQDGRAIGHIETEEIDGLVTSGVISGGMEAKVRAAARAAERMTGWVTISSWRHAWSLSATLSESGMSGGTRIAASSAPAMGGDA